MGSNWWIPRRSPNEMLGLMAQAFRMTTEVREECAWKRFIWNIAMILIDFLLFFYWFEWCFTSSFYVFDSCEVFHRFPKIVFCIGWSSKSLSSCPLSSGSRLRSWNLSLPKAGKSLIKKCVIKISVFRVIDSKTAEWQVFFNVKLS